MELLVGIIVRYTLTPSEKKIYKRDVLPAVVLGVGSTGLDLEILGTGGLMIDGVQNGKEAGQFKFSND